MSKKTLTRKLGRRDFLVASAAVGLAAPAVIRAHGSDAVPDKPDLKVGVIGCGGRGGGAARDILEAAPNIHITALADAFEDRVTALRERLRERDQNVPESHCFAGFDAYRKVLDTDVDLVILAPPPHFQHLHVAAALEAGKHVFTEKPGAVDTWGVHSLLASAEKAEKAGLTVVAGTQFRHSPAYRETVRRVHEGAIGRPLAARWYYLTNQLWYRKREEGWTDMEWMLRDWVNWRWLSGDHLVEQQVHETDAMDWFVGERPVRALGLGGRHRRVTGDQYDFVGVDYEYPGGVHCMALARQINGCHNRRERRLIGSEGYTNCEDTIFDHDGNVVWTYDGPKVNPYVQEHVHLVQAVRTGSPMNELVELAESTLSAIMGRDAAYTGGLVTREETRATSVRFGPTEYAFGPVEMEEVPVPGAPAGAPRPV